MTDADVYYVDERNAFISSENRRPGQVGGNRMMISSPGSSGFRTIGVAGQSPAMYPQGPSPWGAPPPGYWGPQGPGYWGTRSPYGYGPSILDRLSAGKIVDMAAQVFAALMSLPDAPVATSDAVTDVSNLITYQSSLASYAKRDEQIRTLGSLVAKLVG
ncbi:MAG TPA: hypothetical protein VMJ10_06150 [Kofleriaceae bacterium]|nr:hypothetical protein [Kofleriaceae bacterium]